MSQILMAGTQLAKLELAGRLIYLYRHKGGIGGAATSFRDGVFTDVVDVDDKESKGVSLCVVSYLHLLLVLY